LVGFVPSGILDRLGQLPGPQGQQERGREHEQAVVKHDSIFAWKNVLFIYQKSISNDAQFLMFKTELNF
jgi:uncharacterized UPF0160 family protein